jgi:hypothetical protein
MTDEVVFLLFPDFQQIAVITLFSACGAISVSGGTITRWLASGSYTMLLAVRMVMKRFRVIEPAPAALANVCTVFGISEFASE